MKLTPLDIRHKEFKRGMRGYADAEVDEFLDEVADEYERLFKENIDLSERLETLEEKVAGYRRIEETLQKTLVSAQSSAEELKRNSTKEARLILQDAELKARQIVNDSYSQKQAIEQTIAQLRGAEDGFRFKFRQLLDQYVKSIEETPPFAPPSEPAEAGADFARHAEAIKEAIAREAPAKEAPPAPEADPSDTASLSAVGDASVRAGERDEEGLGESEKADTSAAAGSGATDDAAPGRDKILFGESDDLLADVDSGVNENEFKW